MVVQNLTGDEIVDAKPLTFNRGNLCVTGPSWSAFQRRFPLGSFDEFWNLCCEYYSCHSYPLRMYFGVTGGDRVSRVPPSEVKSEEDVEASDESPSHCFVYDLARARGGLFDEGSAMELPFA